MKKIILSSIFAFALLATAGWGVNKSMNRDGNLSDLALANIEALADGESSEGGKIACWETIDNKGEQIKTHKTYCGDCTAVSVKGWYDKSICTK